MTRKRNSRSFRRLDGIAPLGVGPTTLLLCAAAISLPACGAAEPEAQPEAASESQSEVQGDFTLHTPLATVASYEVFSWDYPLPLDGHFDIAVYDYSSGEASGPIRRSPRLELPFWEPGEFHERWPDQILWRVFAYDENGQWLANAEGIAERR